MEENKYFIRVTDDMKFVVVDSRTNIDIKLFDSLELAKEYVNQLNKK